MGRTEKRDLSSAGLHILAMGLMVCDHLWAMLFPAAEWLTCVGRIAFPIFAFLIVEGYRHTRDLRRYLLRLLVWALVTEIPFDLMYGGTAFNPFHQNVLWTFLISLALIALIEKCKARFRPALAVVFCVLLAILGYVLGYVAMADYYGEGVLTVLMFYFLRKRNWKNRLCQLMGMYILNVSLLGGLCYEVTLFGVQLELMQQGFALLALIPIWFYQGRQGFHSKGFRYFCYGFYPAHMLILFLIRAWMLR